MRLFSYLVPVLLLIWAGFAHAADLGPRDGWVVKPTTKSFDRLADDVKAAVKANGMAVVTQAGPTGAARQRGIEIPGNRVIGVFNNKFAVDILRLSTHAMIEAPIRLYVTENEDGTATLSYKTPTYIFTPYVSEAGVGLANEASKLDAIFLKIAEQAAL